MPYTNKYFREVLEKDLKTQELGVNIHCKEDCIHITVPPRPVNDEFTNQDGKEFLKENYNTDILIKNVKKILQPYQIGIKSTNVEYSENIKIRAYINELSKN